MNALCLFCVVIVLSAIVADCSQPFHMDRGSLDEAVNETPSYLLSRKPQTVRKRKAPRKARCCHLGREMAKIGESCTYATSLASILPNYRHYHKMKTKIWLPAEERPVKPGLLKRCKRYKAFYEKCCKYEAHKIDQDLRRMLERLQKIFNGFNSKKKGKKSKKKRLRSGKLRGEKTKSKYLSQLVVAAPQQG